MSAGKDVCFGCEGFDDDWALEEESADPPSFFWDLVEVVLPFEFSPFDSFPLPSPLELGVSKVTRKIEWEICNLQQSYLQYMQSDKVKWDISSRQQKLTIKRKLQNIF